MTNTMISRTGIIAALKIAKTLDQIDEDNLVEALVAYHKEMGHKELSGNDVFMVAEKVGAIRYQERNMPDQELTEE